jgi:phosphinothricin acetyltransferase
MTVVVRFAGISDAAAIQAIYAPFCESTIVSFEFFPPTVVEIAQRVERISARFPWLIAEIGGQVAGYAYASAHAERAAYQWAVDVSVYLDSDHRGHGLGRILYETLFAILVRQGFFKVYGGISMPNPASVALHQATGFDLVGIYRRVGHKFGSWHDVSWWQRDLQAEVADPPPPRSIGDIRDSPEVRAILSDAADRIALRHR